MTAPRKTARTSVAKAVTAPAAGASRPTSAVKAAARPATATATKADKPDKAKKPKMVRDSFTIPKPEYAVIEELKLRAAKLGQPAKKSEVLRAGVKALAALSDEALLASLASVPRVKTGRPAKA
ncbi:hypothetical protein [Ramlibacter sp. AN1133]|uniref:hypothetical protein n=1 Tax=Ramlibacter sp. AN1133 TaxID=3133429 RepID=UPI0030C119EB